MIVKVEQDPDNPDNVMVPIPDEIIGKFNLKEGDVCHIECFEDGMIKVSFDKVKSEIPGIIVPGIERSWG